MGPHGLHDTIVAEAVGIVTNGATLVQFVVMIGMTLALKIMLAASNQKIQVKCSRSKPPCAP